MILCRGEGHSQKDKAELRNSEFPILVSETIQTAQRGNTDGKTMMIKLRDALTKNTEILKNTTHDDIKFTDTLQ